MKKMKSILMIILVWIGLTNVSSQTQWSIEGEGIPNGTAVLVQDAESAGVFKYVGKITNKPFKVSDGTTTYVALCGDNDPLGQATDLRGEDSPADAGLCIRYAGKEDYFRLSVDNNGLAPRLIVEEATAPEHVYIIGGPFNANYPNWILEDAVEIEKDADNPYIFHYKGILAHRSFGDEPGNIKFLVGLSWGGSLFPDGDENAPLSQSFKTATKMRNSGPDTKWTIPSDGSGNGYYEISIDLLEETIVVDSFKHVANVYPPKVFITGDAMPNGWSNENIETLMPVKGQYGVYSWTGSARQGDFKFLTARKSWQMCYVATNADENVVFDQSHSFVYEEDYRVSGNDHKFYMPEAGLCTIVLDFNTMKMTVKKNDLEFSNLWITGSAIPGGNAQLIHDRANPDVKFRYWGELLAGEFKLMTEEIAGATTEYFLPSAVTDAISDNSQMYRTANGTANGWTVVTPSDSYKLEFNVNNNAYKGVIHQVNNVYIVGGATSVGWDSGNSIALVQDEGDPHTFIFNGELKASDTGDDRNHFKFLLQQDWGPKSYHPMTDDESILTSEYISEDRSGDYLWKIEDNQQGNYTIKINTFLETIEAVFSGSSGTSSIQANHPVVFAQNGAVHIKSDSSYTQNVRIVGIDGREAARESFVGTIAIALPQSVYIVEIISNDTSVFRTKVAVRD